jgi:hypothetical protein
MRVLIVCIPPESDLVLPCRSSSSREVWSNRSQYEVVDLYSSKFDDHGLQDATFFAHESVPEIVESMHPRWTLALAPEDPLVVFVRRWLRARPPRTRSTQRVPTED